jgi:plasmid stabilization system protein ParE
VERAVRIAGEALDDVDAIAAYIARDSRLRARQFVADVFTRAESLRTFPERGRIVPEFDLASVHEIYLHRFRLIYRIEPEVVYLIAVIHGARDLSSTWQHEGRGDPRTIT